MTDIGRQWIRWAVRGALMLGVAASITANILHARDNPISQAISAWPPLALLITVELVSRVPLDRKGLGVVRLLATTAIAGIAAYISYWHMVGVVARYGETGAVPYLLPLSVDGLIVVASVSLVELAEHRQELVDSAGAVTAAMPGPAESTPPALPESAASIPSESAAPTMAAFIPPPTAPAAPHAMAEPLSDDAPPAAEIPQHARPGPDEAATGPQAAETVPGSPAAPAPENTGDNHEQDDDPDDHDEEDVDTELDLAADLAPLLPEAREARDELIREGRTVSRDALARRLRRNGHAIRNNRVSELLNALRREQPHLNGARPTVSA